MPRCRVAVTGAQGVGKTTLARDLFAACELRVAGIRELLQGIGQHVKEAGYPLGTAATAETIYTFASEHLRRERSCSGDLVIQDRCLLDLLAYARVGALLAPAANRLLQEIALSSLSLVQAIFFVPMCDATRDTKSEAETADFRALIDAAIPSVAAELGIPIICVDGLPAERLDKALALLAEANPSLFTPSP